MTLTEPRQPRPWPSTRYLYPDECDECPSKPVAYCLAAARFLCREHYDEAESRELLIAAERDHAIAFIRSLIDDRADEAWAAGEGEFPREVWDVIRGAKIRNDRIRNALAALGVDQDGKT